MSLSKEKQIELVISHKKHIVEITNDILETINKSDLRQGYTDAQKLELRKFTNEVLSELSIIAGFCGKREQQWVLDMARAISIHNVFLERYAHAILEFWCTMANTITIDFNKTPFKFFGADLKLKWNQFEAGLKGIVDRRETV